MKDFNEFLKDMVNDLIESGLDEDAHWRYPGYNGNDNSMDAEMANQIEAVICDIDKVDSLMSILRPAVLAALGKVAKDYRKG